MKTNFTLDEIRTFQPIQVNGEHYLGFPLVDNPLTETELEWQAFKEAIKDRAICLKLRDKFQFEIDDLIKKTDEIATLYKTEFEPMKRKYSNHPITILSNRLNSFHSELELTEDESCKEELKKEIALCRTELSTYDYSDYIELSKKVSSRKTKFILLRNSIDTYSAVFMVPRDAVGLVDFNEALREGNICEFLKFNNFLVSSVISKEERYREIYLNIVNANYQLLEYRG